MQYDGHYLAYILLLHLCILHGISHCEYRYEVFDVPALTITFMRVYVMLVVVYVYMYQVYDGATSSSSTLRRACEGGVWGPVTSTSTFSGSTYPYAVLVVFYSDSGTTDTGFEISYRYASTGTPVSTISERYCDSFTVLEAGAESSLFTDGSPPGLDYRDNTYCQWLIVSRSGPIVLEATRFAIEASCDYDTVTVCIHHIVHIMIPPTCNQAYRNYPCRVYSSLYKGHDTGWMVVTRIEY